MDVVVAQGAEAGGHRGSFLGDVTLVPLAELVRACVESSSRPIVAAGGIVDGAGIAEMLELGAAGVRSARRSSSRPRQGAPREHLEALRMHETVVTDAYTGRRERAARTAVLDELLSGPPPLPVPRPAGRFGGTRALVHGRNRRQAVRVSSPRESGKVLVREAEAATGGSELD